MTILSSLNRHPPEDIAVRVGALELAYGRFVADIDSAATRLAAEGVGEGSRVGIRSATLATGHTYANWVAHLATIRLGAAHVSIVEQGSLAAAITGGVIDSIIGPPRSFDDVPAAITRIEYDCDPRRPLAPATPPPDREASAARINLTSGTTGSPKFLTWNAAMIDARIAQVGDGLPLGPDTILYPLLHIRTTAGFRYPIAVWQAGGCVLLPDDADARIRDSDGLARSTLIAASPVQLAERLQVFPDPWAGRAGRTIIVLGGRLPSAVRDTALKIACETLLIGYGSTETGSIALGPSDLIDRHIGAVGYVRNGVKVDIVDAARAAVPTGESGIVRIKTDLMSAGYETAVPGKEAGHFDNGYFYPGDIGRLFDDDLLAIEGRLTDTLNVGGWKVSAPELEAKLSFLPGIDDLVACVMPLAEGDLLTIAVVTRDDVDLTPIATLIQAKLPNGRTFHLVRLKSIPRNAMGKVPRSMIANKLTALYGASRKNLTSA